VVMLFEKDKVRLNENLSAATPVRLGDKLADLVS